ncbi:MAG: type 4a pilus biogenesis protein PilO [Deltaproteobacteria bacterium]|nr:type 4a pilus biogenesis protein PilO [Deltaproteobacteria bacterium]
MDSPALLERLARMTRSQRLVLFAVAYLLIVLLFFFAFYLPKANAIAHARTQQVELQEKKAIVEKRAADKESYETDLEDLTLQLRQALRQLPDDREIPDLLSRISTIGRRIGLEIQKVLPRDEVLREYHAEVPVQLQLKGSFHEVAMFFDRLSKLSRIVYVQNIEMRDPVEQSGKTLVQVSGMLTTFRFLSEEERKAAAEAKKAAERKPRHRGAPREVDEE